MKNYRAILEINKKEQAFQKLAKTPQEAIKMVKDEGFSIDLIKRLEEVEINEEKQRGRKPSKY